MSSLGGEGQSSLWNLRFFDVYAIWNLLHEGTVRIKKNTAGKLTGRASWNASICSIFEGSPATVIDLAGLHPEVVQRLKK